LKILFICTGNICRSPLAEGILKVLLENKERPNLSRSNIDVSSAGTAAYFQSGATGEAIEVARGYGVDLSLHRSRLLNKKMTEDADLILTMEFKHKEIVRRMVPEVAGKIFLLKEYVNTGDVELKDEWELEITDPIGLGFPAYEKCAEEILQALKKLIRMLDEMETWC